MIFHYQRDCILLWYDKNALQNVLGKSLIDLDYLPSKVCVENSDLKIIRIIIITLFMEML